MIFLEPPVDFKSKIQVVSCLMQHGDEILMLRRNDDKFKGGKWCRPAGKMDPGEDKLQTLQREMEEETGLIIDPAQAQFLQTVYVRYPEFDYNYHTYRLLLDKRPEIRLKQDEHQDYVWVKPAAALQLDLLPDEGECLKLVYSL